MRAGAGRQAAGVGADQPGAVPGRHLGQRGVGTAPGVVEQVRAGLGDDLAHLGAPGVDADHDVWMALAEGSDQARDPVDLRRGAYFLARAGRTPPMSRMSAPSATARLAASSAAPNSRVLPRSKNESGVRLITAMMPNEPGCHSRVPSRSVRCGPAGRGYPTPTEAIAPAAFGKNRYVRFLNETTPEYDLTYSDVFMVPSRSGVGSRLDVDLATTDGSGATIPIVTANMTAVSGRRMAETIARRGGLAVIPQDIPADVVADVITWVKSRDLVMETALTLAPTDTAGDALSLLPKRAHNAVVVVEDGRPIGVVTEADCMGVDRFTQLRQVMSADPFTLPAGTPPEQAFSMLHDGRHRLAPVVDGSGRCLGVMTRTGALRATLYSPAVDAAGRLRVGAALGVNGDVAAKAKAAARRGRRRAGRRHRARAPGEDDLRAEGGA